MLAETRAALDVLYGPEAVRAERATRRQAEKTLLQLRRADAAQALDVCVALLATPNDPSAVFAAQTVAFLCRNKDPTASWADAVLGLLRSAVDAGHAKAVQTALSLAVCALVARLKAWPAATLVASVLAGLGASDGASAPHALAALALLTLLPEELENEQLAISEWILDECRGDLSSAASAPLVAFAGPLLATPHAAAALRCLGAWTRASLVPWPSLALAMPAALDATRAALVAPAVATAEAAAARLEQLQSGCELLSSAAAADFDGERADLFVEAVLGLRPGFEAVGAEAAAAASRADGSGELATGAAAALSALYAEVATSYAAAVAKHPPLLELLLHSV